MADNDYLSAAFPNSSKPQSDSGLQINKEALSSPVFNLSHLSKVAQNYNALNFALNELIGYDVRWFRAVPQIRSQDVIFQEWTLYNVEDTPKCIKVVLPDGNFPDSKYNFDLMGLEYEIPLEIHIDKGYWENMVGSGTAPQKEDIVYFAMPNKLYEVVSSYLYRGILEQETTWKVNLRKYQPKAARKEGNALKETIDKYTVSVEEIFGEKLESDIKKLTDDKQMSPFNSTEKDPYKTVNAYVDVINNRLEIYGTLISEAYYDLNKSDSTDAIIFNGTDIIGKNTDRCLTSWIMIDPGVVEEYDVESLTSTTTSPGANYLMRIKSKNKGFEVGDNIQIFRPGSLNFYAYIVSDSSTTIGSDYYIKIDDAVIKHLETIKSDWPSARNFKMRVIEPVSILDGKVAEDNENQGLTVNLYANQYIKIEYGTQEYIAVMDKRLIDKQWYGLIVNIGNSWNQYNVYVYKQHVSSSEDKLEIVFYETIDLTGEDVTVDKYTINKSPSFLTNLRLYNYTMEEEKQKQELLSYFVKDGDQLIIAIDGNGRFIAPYIGMQR